MIKETTILKIDQATLRRMDPYQRIIFVDLLCVLDVVSDTCLITQTWIEGGSTMEEGAGATLRSMIDDGYLEIKKVDGGYKVKLLPLEREEKPFKEEEGAKERKSGSTGSTVVKTGSTSSSLGSFSWEELATEVIERNGQSYNEVYLQKTIEALADLGAPIDRVRRVILRGLNEDNVKSVPGWISTTGKSLLKKTAATDNHPMYQKYDPDTSEPPAGNLEVRTALENMKEILRAAEATAREARQEDSDHDGGDTENGGTP